MSENFFIAFSGPARSGKGTCSDYLVSKGFTKVSMADYLRELVCQLYAWRVEDTKDIIKKEEELKVPVYWDKLRALELSALIDESIEIPAKPIPLHSRRAALQYIGTEVLRELDQEFHIKSLFKRLNPNLNYTIDDIRFYNEAEWVKSIGGIVISIKRPSLNLDGVVYTHPSEKDFSRVEAIANTILINDGAISDLLTKLQQYLSTLGFRKSRMDKYK